MTRGGRGNAARGRGGGGGEGAIPATSAPGSRPMPHSPPSGARTPQSPPSLLHKQIQIIISQRQRVSFQWQYYCSSTAEAVYTSAGRGTQPPQLFSGAQGCLPSSCRQCRLSANLTSMMAEKDHACRRLKSCDGRMRSAMVGCDARCFVRW